MEEIQKVRRAVQQQIIVDVETLDMQNNIVYEIAWAIVKRNKIQTIKSYVVQELLPLIPTGSFSKEKSPRTFQNVSDGKTLIKPFTEIWAEMIADFSNSQYLYAYNSAFDSRKVIETAQYFNCFEMGEILTAMLEKWRCLWKLAGNTILYKQSYIDFCNENDFITEKGNFMTSAEVALRYLRGDIGYVEQHVALDDVLDEYEIYLAIKHDLKRELGTFIGPDYELATHEHFAGSAPHRIRKLDNAFKS